VRTTSLLEIILGQKKTKVLSFCVEDMGIVVDVKPSASVPYCSGCMCPVHEVHDARSRLWRHLDLAGMELRLRYRMRRVDCPRCGTCVELVPWADPGSWFTQDFEEHVAYLAQTADKTTVADTMRVAWRTVGSIVERVVARFRPGDPLDNLTHIGIDELSYRKNHEYITVVIDHVSKRVVWARPGKDAATLAEFFKELGPERCAKIEAVTLDMSAAFVKAVTDAGLGEKMIFDRFHVEELANKAVDEVRRAEVRAEDGAAHAKVLKRTRYILLKRPWNLSAIESEKLSRMQKVNSPIYRAYLMKETLGEILDNRDVDVARVKLHELIGWAQRSRLEPFKKLAITIKQHFEGILAYIPERLNNGRTEGMNGKIRTITRRSFGFHSASNLIALIFLCCSGIALQPVFKFALT
jgi:transposase